MLQWGRAFSATAALSTMPYSAISSAAPAGLPLTQSTDSAYTSKNRSTASGCSSAKARQATATPVIMAEPLSRASHSSVRSRATRRFSSLLWAAATKGWGSRARSAVPAAMAATHSACSLFQSTVTSVSGSRPLCSSR